MKLAEQAKKRFERNEERIARAADKQLQNSVKQVQQSKEKDIQSTVIENKGDNSSASMIEVVESQYRVTGRGRRVAIPQRFRT